jgi:hypothetical protein
LVDEVIDVAAGSTGRTGLEKFEFEFDKSEKRVDELLSAVAQSLLVVGLPWLSEVLRVWHVWLRSLLSAYLTLLMFEKGRFGIRRKLGVVPK